MWTAPSASSASATLGPSHAIDLLAHAHGLGVVPLRRGEVAGLLGRQAQRVVLEAGLLVVRAVLADDERQGALGKAQRLGVVAGPIEGLRGLAQVLQLLGGLLGARAGRSIAARPAQRTTSGRHALMGHTRARLTCRDSRW